MESVWGCFLSLRLIFIKSIKFQGFLCEVYSIAAHAKVSQKPLKSLSYKAIYYTPPFAADPDTSMKIHTFPNIYHHH
jgi:hypothetical protein